MICSGIYVTIVTFIYLLCNNSNMGRIIRLRNHTDKWLSSIDENLEVALNKVQSDHISHRELMESIESLHGKIEDEIRDLRS